MIRGVLFDMDGLMIDSEPLWQRAEIEIFGTVGVELTRDMCLETRGRRVDEVVEHWWAQRPWVEPSRAAIRDAIVGRVIELVRSEGEAKPGLSAAIDLFAARGLPLGVASSSDYAIIEAALGRLTLAQRFAVVHSGQDEAVGKPHPGVYRSAARKLGVACEACLALEDSPSGVASAKAAGMLCVAVMDATSVPAAARRRERERLAAADAVLDSLEQIDAELLERLARRP
jgi:sugar-phosphatase